MTRGPENQFVPDGELAPVKPESKAQEKIQAALGRLKKTALPVGLYAALIFGGNHAETLAQSRTAENNKNTKHRSTLVAKEKKAQPKNEAEAEATGSVELRFIKEFEITTRAELEQLRELNRKVGIEYVNRIFYKGSIGREEGATPEHPVVFDDFDKHPLAGPRLLKVLDDSMPKELLRLGVRVHYQETPQRMPKAYGEAVAGTDEKPLYEAGHFDQRVLETTVTRVPDYAPMYLSEYELVAHEFGHAASPVASEVADSERKFSNRERFLMMLALVKRIESENRFKSTYVESIKAKTDQETIQFKIEEYLAETFAAAAMGKILAVEDMTIISNRIGEVDFVANKKKLDALLAEWEDEDSLAREKAVNESIKIRRQAELKESIDKIRREHFMPNDGKRFDAKKGPTWPTTNK